MRLGRGQVLRPGIMTGNGDEFGVSGGMRQQRPPSGYRPPRNGTHSLRMRLLGGVAVALAIGLVAVSLTAYLKYRSVWDSIQRVQVSGLGDRPPQFTTAMNILLIGSDSRSGANQGFGAGISGQRSDTIIVLHLAPGGHSAIVLSIPRDSVVPVLSCPPEAGTPGQAAQPGQMEQINATFAYGGPGCLWKTVEQTTHLRIDHFIELNFTGFEHVINDIGGVSICLPFAINDPLSRLRLGPGVHHVGGAEALAFWRARYIGEGSDLQRIERDQYLMAAVLQGVEHSDLLGSPSRLLSVITDVARSMTTDSGLDVSTMIHIVESLRQMQPGTVQFIELPTVAYAPNPDWVSWPASDRQLFLAIAHDRVLPRTAGKTAPRPPARAALAALAALAAYLAGPRPGPSPAGSPQNLVRRYGGITGSTNICHNGRAFAGPRGGS
jgi:LCP family protein required for cell wall assembly